MPQLVLKPGREKSLERRHPWIFSGAVANIQGEPEVGGTVDVVNYRGQFLARAAYNPHSQIIARVWTFDDQVVVDENFFHERILKAIQVRNFIFPNLISGKIPRESLMAFRIVHGESDRVPGLILDCYSDVLVMQFHSAGVEHWRDVIIRQAMELTGLERVYEHSDFDIRRLEGLPSRNGPIYGDFPQGSVHIVENGLNYIVDFQQGHKTGFYLDQRFNRLKVRSISKDREILDCFCYTGGFALNTLYGGAKKVTAIDASNSAISLARKNLSINQLDDNCIRWIEGDVFSYLRNCRDRDEEYDMVILDPPKFAYSVSQVQKAARGYKDINLLALKLIRSGGILVTFSCSGGVDASLFQKIVAGAAVDAGVQVQILEWLQQDMDHPVALEFPEGRYLKGMIIRKE